MLGRSPDLGEKLIASSVTKPMSISQWIKDSSKNCASRSNSIPPDRLKSLGRIRSLARDRYSSPSALLSCHDVVRPSSMMLKKVLVVLLWSLCASGSSASNASRALRCSSRPVAAMLGKVLARCAAAMDWIA